jgi:hypothetical protein
MPQNTITRSFSSAISDPLRTAYQAGGYGLTILTLGAILMLTAFFWQQQGPVRYVVLAVGTILTFFTLAYVALREFPRLKRAQESLTANKEMIDAVQLSAVELTELVSDLQALAFKNANQIAEILDLARPLMRKIPIIGEYADSEAIIKAEGFSKWIVSSTQNARKLVVDLQKSLLEADPTYLKAHLEDLSRYRGEVQRMLAGG